jgi:hypothetical protein
MKNNKVDFVITWVDGSDINWIAERNRYAKEKIDESRYRDWDILRYWFRAVERYASWVNKIYFVTWGHIPSWLNINCEKLVIVRHEDFIEKKYLPTFNSCVIELNLYKINGLSDNFVYFNDDMFINDYVDETDFFCDNLPCDFLNYDWIWKKGKNSTKINYNCQKIIDKHYNLNKLQTKKNIKYYIKRFLYYNQQPRLAMIPQHVPTSYKIETFKEVWDKEEKYLSSICNNKFRTSDDVSQWLIQFWQIASKNYAERNENVSKYYEINSKNIDENLAEIQSKKYKLICINDSEKTDNFTQNKEKINNMFKKMYPNKSIYEK